MKLSWFRLTDENLARWMNSLQEFEEHFVYPLGEDSFSISHGPDYLAFFKRIGDPAVYCVSQGDRIVAAGGGIISKRLNAWYLCDMKVLPYARGKKIPRKLFTRYFFMNYLKCRRGFALNMENSDGSKNPIQKILESLPWTPLKKGARVLFFYEDQQKTSEAMLVLSKRRENLYFSDLSGIKDLILKSNHKSIPLLHLEWGDGIRNKEVSLPKAGMLHMWCLNELDPMVKELESINIMAKASGFIFQHGMNNYDWSELRTSEL